MVTEQRQRELIPDVGSDVAAIVVTFHPDQGVAENLNTLRRQVGHVIVVDNGSGCEELKSLRSLCTQLKCELIENGTNLGIAAALNRGIRRARTLKINWVMLFDQDSCITEGFVGAMLQGFAITPWGARLGILVPRYRDRRMNTDIPPDRVREGLESAMTSGSLLQSSIFEEQGEFVDALFIDAVDYEFSLRLRRAGYILDQCDAAVLLHAPGHPIVHSFRGKRLFVTANYGPTRRYYQERNKVWVARRYWRDFPVFCLKLFVFSAKDLLKIFLAEPNKWHKCRFMIRGFMDGLRERMGALPSPRPMGPNC